MADKNKKGTNVVKRQLVRAQIRALERAGIDLPANVEKESLRTGKSPRTLMQEFAKRGGLDKWPDELERLKSFRSGLTKARSGLKKAGSWALRRGIPGVGLAAGLLSSKPAGAGSDIVTPTRKRGGSIKRKRGGTVSRKGGSKIMYGYKAGGKV